MAKKLLWVGIIAIMGLTLVATYYNLNNSISPLSGVQVNFKQPQNHPISEPIKAEASTPLTPPVTASTSEYPTVTMLPTVPAPKVYTSPALPGFSMVIPNGWMMQVKEFKTINNDFRFEKVALPTYSEEFSQCGGQCMAVRLTKNSAQLQVIFFIAQDDNGGYCSQKLPLTKLRNSWIRVKADSSYYYSSNFDLNVKMANPPEPWYENLDSSAPFKANEVVKLCEHGTNGVLSIRPTVELWGDDVHSEYGIAVDHPKLTGTIDTKTLNEADQIITSIKGIVTLQN